MKKNIYLTLVSALLTSLHCHAQIEDFEIEFEVEKAYNVKEPQAIDMGGSVLWSSFNMYATEPSEVGIYCGWGDPTGNLKFQASNPDEENYIEESACVAMYGGLSPAYNISGSELDIVHVHLGKGWVLPQKWHFDELHDCKWEIVRMDDNVAGYKVTAQNGNSIFLPAWNDVIDNESGRDVVYGAYWTSSACSLYEIGAYCFDLALVYWWLKSDSYDCESIEVEGRNQLTAVPRWQQLMIRPVKLKE